MPISRPLSIAIVVAIPITIIIGASYFVINYYKPEKQNKNRNDKIIKITPHSTSSQNDQKFNHMMIDVYSMMSMARNIFPIDTTLAGREKSLSDIKDIGIYYWDRNLEVLDSLKKTNSDPEVIDKLSGYQEYCKLSKTCYQLMYKAVDEHTSKYDEEIDRQFDTMTKKYNEITGKE